MASTSRWYIDLPEDVIVDILLRLPVKTLLRFKCVCKRWCALIESSRFVNAHFNHKNNPQRLLVRHCKPGADYTYGLYLDEMFREYEEPDHLQIPCTVSNQLGPVNGVFFVVTFWEQMALINPAMRQFRPLPLVSPVIPPYLTTYQDFYGFGMDPLTGDYKVVLLRFFWNEEIDEPHDPALISVYNSRTDSWRHFEQVELVNSKYFAYKSLCNTYLNGTYYWLTEYNKTDAAILAFDMSNETFRMIPIPFCFHSKEGELALYGDSIALLMTDLDTVDKCVDVWVMVNEGCWNKTFTVGPFVLLRWPVGFWKNSELLLETEALGLKMYNVNTGKLRTLDVQKKENGFFIYGIFSYKESLVSIKREGSRCMEWDLSSHFIQQFFSIP